MTKRRWSATAVAMILGLGAIGCQTTLEATRVVSPDAAARAQRDGSKLAPTAIVHGEHGGRTPLAAGAKIAADRVVLGAAGGEVVHKLGPDDVIQVDAQDRIVAVRSGERRIEFVPGTAVSPPGTDEVRGKLAGAHDEPASIPLAKGDAIEMSGEVADGDRVPGGHVESSRSTAVLVTGVVLLSISYLPTAVVGARSPRSADRTLLVPIAGPWIDLVGRDKCVPPPGSEKLPVDPCIEESASRIGIVVSGVVQGLAAIVTAVGIPARLEIHEDAVSRAGIRMAIEPWSVRGGAVLGARGEF